MTRPVPVDVVQSQILTALEQYEKNGRKATSAKSRRRQITVASHYKRKPLVSSSSSSSCSSDSSSDTEYEAAIPRPRQMVAVAKNFLDVLKEKIQGTFDSSSSDDEESPAPAPPRPRVTYDLQKVIAVTASCSLQFGVVKENERDIPTIFCFRKSGEKCGEIQLPDVGSLIDVDVSEMGNFAYVLTTDFVVLLQMDKDKQSIRECSRISLGTKGLLAPEQSIVEVDNSSFAVNNCFRKWMRIVALPIALVEPQDHVQCIGGCALLLPSELSPVKSDRTPNVTFEAWKYFSVQFPTLALNELTPDGCFVASSVPICHARFLPANIMQKRLHRGFVQLVSLMQNPEMEQPFVDSYQTPVFTNTLAQVQLDVFQSKLVCKTITFQDKQAVVLRDLVTDASGMNTTALADSGIWIQFRLSAFANLFVVARYHSEDNSVSFALHSEQGCLRTLPHRIKLIDPNLLSLFEGTKSSLFPMTQIHSGNVELPSTHTRALTAAAIQVHMLRLCYQVQIGMSSQMHLSQHPAEEDLNAAEFWIRIPGDRQLYRFAYYFKKTHNNGSYLLSQGQLASTFSLQQLTGFEPKHEQKQTDETVSVQLMPLRDQYFYGFESNPQGLAIFTGRNENQEHYDMKTKFIPWSEFSFANFVPQGTVSIQ